MFIKNEFVNEAFEKAKDNFEKLRIATNRAVDRTKNPDERTVDLDRFVSVMKEIGSLRAYKPGQQIEENDMIRISNEVGLFLDSLSYQFRSMAGRDKKFDITYSLITATDYLYAIAMKELGSPDIPPLFGKDMKNHISDRAYDMISKAKLNNTPMLVSAAFIYQRRKDVPEMRDSFGDKLSAVQNKTATPKQVQELVAEYRALKMRQEKHGWIWRLFHSGENEDRNNLISEMSDALKGVLGQDAKIDSEDPLTLAMSLYNGGIAEKLDAATLEDSMGKRIGISSEAFDTSSLISEEGKNDINKELQESLKNQFEKENNNDKEPPIDSIDPVQKVSTV